MKPLDMFQASYERFVGLTASPETHTRYCKSLNTFFNYFPEKREPSEFSRSDVEDYRIYRRKAGVSATTVNYDVQIVRAFWNWMIGNEMAAYNPAASIKRLKQQEPVRKSLSPSVQEELYDVCLNVHERILVGLVLSTGMRANTLAQLEKEEFNFEQKMLTIPPEKIKARRALELPIRDEELRLIQDLPPGNLWGAWAINARALSKKFNKILMRAGTDLRGLRTGRRTAATTYLRRGMDVRTVARILDHKKIETTMKYLTPATDEEIRAAMRGLPA